jgi:hypothetical protein
VSTAGRILVSQMSASGYSSSPGSAMRRAASFFVGLRLVRPLWTQIVCDDANEHKEVIGSVGYLCEPLVFETPNGVINVGAVMNMTQWPFLIVMTPRVINRTRYRMTPTPPIQISTTATFRLSSSIISHGVINARRSSPWDHRPARRT